MLWKEFYKNGLHYFKKVFMIISHKISNIYKINRIDCDVFYNQSGKCRDVMFRFWKNDFSKITGIRHSEKFRKLLRIALENL
jgi:hypothetical protein